MIRLFALTVCFLLALAVPASAQGPTPKQAARAAKTCFADRGWSARLSDHGRTVDAEAPRERSGYPTRPWFSVAFYGGGSNETRMGLNRAELRIAAHCKRAAWR